ncbi:chloride channel, nucleotide-sensitive, 1A, partial [Lecanoromycetidae sp. Uapishka_2]
MEVLHSPPNTQSYTPLSVHQSQTPESFFSGPPVLYHHSPSTTLLINSHDLEAVPALAELVSGAQRSTNGTSGHINGDEGGGEDMGQELSIPNVGVWVTSDSKNVRVSIPYPSISLHAVQGPTSSHPASLFLQLLTQEQTFDDHDPDSTISLTIIPAPSPTGTFSEPTATATEAEDLDAADAQSHDSAQMLYTALSACANLHPDPMSGSEADEEEGRNPTVLFEGDSDLSGVYPLGSGGSGGAGLPPPMPGSGGWITAENVNEFFDEEGNFRAGGVLGEGAGSVRTREEDGEEDGNGDATTDETKWRRTD